MPECVKSPQTRTRASAIVTGAASNIGRAIATDLARDHAVVLADVIDASSLAKEIGGGAVAVRGDIRVAADCERWVRVASEIGILEIVVNSAGVTAPPRPIAEISSEEWEHVIAVNLTGAFNLARAVIPTLTHQGTGGIVLISSRAGKTGFAALAVNPHATKAHYAASKAGVISLTKSLALELARYGIRVNCVAPGPIEGTMLPPEQHDEIRSRVPLARLGTPTDIAAAVRYLISSEASFVTGHTLDVNGGTLMD